MKALIVIDFVNDFVADNGSLTCGAPAQAIDGNIAAKINEFLANNDFVVTANDYHYNDNYNRESKLFPKHCLIGTEGRAIYGKAGEAAADPRVIHLSKTRYSAFCGTSLDMLLRERNIDTVHLVGVCTDICVLHAAIEAYNLGYNIVVEKDCVASFNQEGHDFALKHMQNTLGATIK